MFDIGKELQKAFDEGCAYGIKEFAERLKCESYQAANGGYISSDRAVSVADIDKLANEMTEKEGGAE